MNRQNNGEYCTHSFFGFHLDFPLMFSDGIIGDRHAYARTLPHILGREKRLENLFSDIRRDPDTVISYSHINIRRIAMEAGSYHKLSPGLAIKFLIDG